MAEKKTKSKKAVAVNKKTDNNRWQVILLVVLITFFVMSLLFLWVYASNKPNYKDLQKAYNKLNIPSDWQLVNENSNKGTMSMFCFGNPSDTSPCPVLSKEFKIEKNDNINSLIDDIIGNNVSQQIDLKCEDLKSTGFDCSKKIEINNMYISVSVSTIDSQGKNGKWATILIFPKN